MTVDSGTRVLVAKAATTSATAIETRLGIQFSGLPQKNANACRDIRFGKIPAMKNVKA